MLAYSEYWLNNLYMTGVKFKPVSRIGENAGEKLCVKHNSLGSEHKSGICYLAKDQVTRR